MKPKKPQGDPVKTLLIIIIGACLIILVDLFLLGGKDYIWPKRKTLSPEEVSAIQNAHHKYMREGPVEAQPVVQAYEDVVVQIDKSDSINPYEGKITQSNREVSEQQEWKFAGSLPSLNEYIEQTLAEQASKVTLESPGPAKENPAFVPIEAEEAVQDKVIQAAHQQMKFDQIEPSATVVEEDMEPLKVSAAKPVYKYAEPRGGGLVVIMIDDMGLTQRSREVEDLPGPLTLSYLPYADHLPTKTARAKKNGHELMVHMPMQPINGNLDGGPAVLKVGQEQDEFVRTLKSGLSKFDGYVGINNHMGSRLTQDVAAMRLVMAELKKRGLYFVDSKTIGTSVAADIAAESGLSYAERDVFLDHEITTKFVRGALARLERTARRKGYAIAIGHPHRVTIDALKEWLPTLKGKGLTLVPASAVVKRVKEPLVAANHNVGGNPSRASKGARLVGGSQDDSLSDDVGLSWEEGEAAPDAVIVTPEDVVVP